MSSRELAKSLLDRAPEWKLPYIIAYLEDVTVPDEMPEEIPNDETLEAMAEVDRMIADGTGEHFTGSTDDLFRQILEG